MQTDSLPLKRIGTRVPVTPTETIPATSTPNVWVYTLIAPLHGAPGETHWWPDARPREIRRTIRGLDGRGNA